MSNIEAYVAHAHAREHGTIIAEITKADRLRRHDRSEHGWTPPRKGYSDQLERN